jgi:hypothetical protein
MAEEEEIGEGGGSGEGEGFFLHFFSLLQPWIQKQILLGPLDVRASDILHSVQMHLIPHLTTHHKNVLMTKFNILEKMKVLVSQIGMSSFYSYKMVNISKWRSALYILQVRHT